MGWSSGSDLMDQCIVTIERNVESHLTKVDIYMDLIEAFEEHDWDTQYECTMTAAFKDALKELNPDLAEDLEKNYPTVVI